MQKDLVSRPYQEYFVYILSTVCVCVCVCTRRRSGVFYIGKAENNLELGIYTHRLYTLYTYI